ncbi:unnamed protein product [Pleuronectes platessa]|uniref:Uncharacterized protein n=1 Tax=Pleuronectes platessa TaxID=8262 RepID=A0A9N7YK11_PLEPL|nr:unnamed protein product [Pleuronectes platessa]
MSTDADRNLGAPPTLQAPALRLSLSSSFMETLPAVSPLRANSYGVSVFPLNRDRTLDEAQAALRHEYKWPWSLCCAREPSHKLREREAAQPPHFLCPDFRISSVSLRSTRAPLRDLCSCCIPTWIRA